MNNVKNIIFDLDGTLIDSSEGVVEAVNYSLVQLGEPEQQPEAIKRFIGYPLSNMYPYFSEKPLDELYKHFQVKAAETVVASTVKLEQVDESLKILKERGYNLAIASTKIKRHIDGIIEKFDWSEYFTAHSGGDEVPQVKPAPDIFHLTLKKMKAQPSNSIVVGDTINDIYAAKEVPMKVVAVESPYGGRHDILAARPDYYIQQLSKLLDLLPGDNSNKL